MRELSQALALEAWLWAGGRWKGVLLFLSKNKEFGTKTVPKDWVRTRRDGGARVYHCRICGTVLDRDSRKYPRTKHANVAINDHGSKHLDEVAALLQVKKSLPKGFVL